MPASAQQENKASKPFANVRLVIDPPEGLKALDVKFKRPTLFLEVMHGNEKGILNKQWIPLPVEYDPKAPVDQKTHYGQKTTGSKQPNTPVRFDSKVIPNFNVPRAKNNENVPFTLAGIGTNGKSRILYIPSSSGECQLAITPDGNVSINRTPSDLDLNIETYGNINTGNNLRCRSVRLKAKNIKNTHTLSASTVSLEAQEKIINSGTLSGRQSVEVLARKAFINQPDATLTSDGRLKISQTPIVTNHGLMSGKKAVLSPENLENSQTGQILGDDIEIIGNTVLENNGLVDAQKKLTINTTTLLTNKEGGTLKAKETLDINVKGLNNAGLIDSLQDLLVQTRENIKNKLGARMTAKQSLELLCEAVILNSGNMHSAGPLTCKANKIIQDLKSSRIESEQQLSLEAVTEILNAGLISSNETDLKVIDLIHGIIKQLPDATISAEKQLNIDSRTILNEGLMQSVMGKCQLNAAEEFENHQTGTVKAPVLLEATANKLVNRGLMVGRNHLKITHSRLNNTKTGVLASEGHLSLSLNTGSKNHGGISAKNIIGTAEDFENSATGILKAGELLDLNIQRFRNLGRIESIKELIIKTKTIFENLASGTILSHSDMSLFCEAIIQNSGAIESLGPITCEAERILQDLKSSRLVSKQKLSLIATSLIHNLGAMLGGSIEATVASHQTDYTFLQMGELATESGDFIFTGQGISHTEGSIKTNHNIDITAININLLAEIKAIQNIGLHYSGGVWVVSDAVQAMGELGFYLPEGGPITEARKVPGSLKYTLLPSATNPLHFLANQEAVQGSFEAETPTPILIGNAATPVELKSKKSLKLNGASLDFHRGNMIGIEGVELYTIGQMILGRQETPLVAIGSNGLIKMIANGLYWNQLEMIGRGDLHIAGQGSLIDTSSQVNIAGNALWEIPTRHQLLITQTLRTEVIPGKWSFFRRKVVQQTRQVPDSESAITRPASVIIGGKLAIGHNNLELFASTVSCKEFEGNVPNQAMIRSFVPFSTITERYFSHQTRRRHTFHRDDVHDVYLTRPKVILGAPINANFSIGSDLHLSVPHFDMSGILSAVSIEIISVQHGRIGSFETRLSLAPMASRAFRSQIPLIDYLEPSMLYKISLNGDTVFMPVLPPIIYLTPMLPRMTLATDGSLVPTPSNVRRLLTREQEEDLLIKVMLKEFGKAFLTRELNTSGSILNFLEANTIAYSQMGQKLLGANQSPRMLICQGSADNALQIGSINVTEQPLFIPQPCLIEKIETLIHANGHIEQVSQPIMLVPKSFDNPLLRANMGYVFGAESIKFVGATGGELHIRANIDTNGIVTFQDFNMLSRTRSTWTRNETVINKQTQKSMMGKNKTTVTVQQVPVAELQPDNTMRAKGVRYTNNDHIHFNTVKDTVGEDGMLVEGAQTFVDQAIVQNQIGQPFEKKQKGPLGLGGTKTTSQRVSQVAIGSEIQSAGPVRIQAHYGLFDATQFKDAIGQSKPVELEISELHFHELLRLIEANDKAAADALREQERTAKRKTRQGTIWMLISLPASYYLGGFISSYLESIMGVTIGQTVANGAIVAKATVAQTAAIVAVSGAGAGLLSAAMQGQDLAKGALNGAIFASVGNAVANAPALANVSDIGKDVARGVSAGAVQTALNGGNLFENTITGGIAAGVASSIMPGSAQDLSLTQSVGKAMLEVGVAVAARNGTVDELAVNLGSAAMGAALGKSASDLGSRHGQQLGTANNTPSVLPVPHNTNTSREKISSPQAELLETATQEASRLLAENGVHIPKREIKRTFQKHPALQGTPQEVETNLVRLGQAEGNTRDLNSAFVKGLQKVFDATLITLVQVVGVNEAHAGGLESQRHQRWQAYNPEEERRFFLSSELLGDIRRQGHSGSEQNTSVLRPVQPGCGAMALRALTGDRSPEVLACQRQNRESIPWLAEGYDAFHQAHEELHVGTRALGAMQTLEGAAQITAGFSLGAVSAPTIVGPAAGTVLATMGADNVMAGLQALCTGEPQATVLLQATSTLGKKTGLYGPEAAVYIDAGLNILSAAVTPSTLTFQYNAARRANVATKIVDVSRQPELMSEVVSLHNQQFGQSAWQHFRSNPQERIRITGGRSVREVEIEDRIADELYLQIRNSTHDVSQISRNLNIPEFQVKRVKEHLFYNTHQLDHGMGIGRFDPDFNIATAWQRLEAGTHTEADLLIFRHEHFESRFEGIFKTDYKTAHDAANRAGRPSGLRNDFDITEVKYGNVYRDQKN